MVLKQAKVNSRINTKAKALTFLLIKDQLRLKLSSVIQSSLDLSREPVAGLWAVQEVTGAALLHELCAGIAGELAETVGAVDDGVEGLNLSVPQNKVTVCWEKREN